MRVALMNWLVEGTRIGSDWPLARTEHVLSVDIRSLPERTEAELETAARAFWAAVPDG